MTTPDPFKCDDCANYTAVFSDSGKEGMRPRCDKEDEDGVAVLLSVVVIGDCPYALPIYITDVDDAYPKRIISTTPTRKPYVSTQHFRDRVRPEVKAPKRRRDNY